MTYPQLEDCADQPGEGESAEQEHDRLYGRTNTMTDLLTPPTGAPQPRPRPGPLVRVIPEIGASATVQFDGICFADITATSGGARSERATISVYRTDIPALIEDLIAAHAAATRSLEARR